MNLYRIPTRAARDRDGGIVTHWYTYVRADKAADAVYAVVHRKGIGHFFGKPEEITEDLLEPGVEVIE